MGFYRKKPVVIQAERWLVFDRDNSILSAVKPLRDRGDQVGKCKHCGKPHADHGWLDMLGEKVKIAGYVVCPGDWIVRNPNGDIYPVKPSVFDALYEEVEGDD